MALKKVSFIRCLKKSTIMRQLVIVVFVFLSVNLLAQDYKVTIEPVNGKFKEVEYYMWIPENLKTIKGIILHQHGCGETAYKSGRNAFYDLQWQTLAKKHDFALMGSSYLSTTDCFDWVNPEEGSYSTFIRGISEIAKKSNHEELGNVPWVLWGHSGGGHWVYDMVLQHPDKILCSVMRSPAWTDTSSLGLQVPLLCLVGIQESYNNFSKDVWCSSLEAMKYRIRENAPVCIAFDPTSGHETANSRVLAISFIDEILKLRSDDRESIINRSNQCYVDLDNLMLTDKITDIEYIDNANWFPNKLFAEKWLEFIKTGNVTDSTPPTESPYGVEARKQGKGVVISWQATADIESGIKGFRIYRNNKIINMDSSQSNWNFQFDYHDNPLEIYDRFEYVDRNINKEGEYKYQVSLINKAGLESAKSKAIVIKEE